MKVEAFRMRCVLGALAMGIICAIGCGSSSSSSTTNSSSGLTATTTTLSSSSTSTASGTSITLTATLSPAAATGTVTFYSGSTLLGTATLSSGTATFATSFSTTGTYSLTAVYGGSSTYATSSSTAISVKVSAALTTTTTVLATSATTAAYGSSITFTASISPSTAGGTVTFYDSATEIGNATVSSGQATLVISTLAAGSHSITASYGGSDAFTSSASAAISVTVTTSGETWNINTGANSADLIEDTEFAYTINIDLSSISVTSDAGAISVIDQDGSKSIALNGSAVASVTEDATLGLTINSAFPAGTYVEYVLSGSYTKCVTIYSTDRFKLTLNGPTIASSNGPAINIQSEVRAFVVLPGSTTTILTDTSTYSTRYLSSGSKMDLKSAFFSEGPLIFSGNGNLNITSAAKHALCSDRHIRMRDGTFALTSNAKNGIHANNAFILDGGTVTIQTPSGAGKGIKVEGKESTNQPLGFIAINDGTLTINTYDKAITASWKAEDDAETASTDDDPDPRVTVSGGTINITTFGTPVEDELAPEGIESKSLLTINAGTITISTTDDGLNAGTGMVINGGSIYAVSSKNDAFDSNGYLTVNGGLLVARGSAAPEAGLDCDFNTFTVNGGTFVGLGGTTSNPTASVSKQNSVVLQNLSTIGMLGIKNTSGSVAFAYTVPDTSSTILLSSPSLTTGGSYTVYTGGTLTSWSGEFHGLYTDSVGYAGGSSRTTFTISSPLTTLRF